MSEVYASSALINMHRLAMNLYAFRDPNTPPTFIGGRFIPPGERATFGDHVTQFLDWTIYRIFSFVMRFFFEIEIRALTQEEAKVKLLKDLGALHMRICKEYERLKPMLQNNLKQLSSESESMRLLFYYAMHLEHLPEWKRGLQKHLAESSSNSNLDFLDDQNFLSMHRDVTEDHSVHQTSWRNLFAWSTISIPTPFGALIELMRCPKGTTTQSDQIGAWVKACQRAPIPPQPKDYYNLICSILSFPSIQDEAAQAACKSIHEKALNTLERLWLQFGLDLNIPDQKLYSRLSYLKVGDVISLESPLNREIAPQAPRKTFRIVSMSEPDDPSILKTCLVEMAHAEGDASEEVQSAQYELNFFKNALCALIHRKRLEKGSPLHGCPWIRKELPCGQSAFNGQIQDTFCLTEVSIFETLRHFDGDFSKHAVDLEEALRWMVKSRTYIDLSPSGLGVSPSTNRLEFKAAFIKAERQVKEGRELSFDVSKVEESLFQHIKLSAIPDSLIGAMQAFYNEANIKQKKEIDTAIVTTIKDKIQGYKSSQESASELYYRAAPKLEKNDLRKLLLCVQSKQLEQQVNQALITLYTNKAIALDSPSE